MGSVGNETWSKRAKLHSWNGGWDERKTLNGFYHHKGLGLLGHLIRGFSIRMLLPCVLETVPRG
jgi:hypothetical protein